jgi:hypothetical protein
VDDFGSLNERWIPSSIITIRPDMRIRCQDLIDANDGDDVESRHDPGLHSWGACHVTVGTLDGHSSERGNGWCDMRGGAEISVHSSTVNIHRWDVGRISGIE